MLDYIVDIRRCERVEVGSYETYIIGQKTARMFIEDNPQIFDDGEAFASLRFYMIMTMKLKLATIETRKQIQKHPMWKVYAIQYIIDIYTIM